MIVQFNNVSSVVVILLIIKDVFLDKFHRLMRENYAKRQQNKLNKEEQKMPKTLVKKVKIKFPNEKEDSSDENGSKRVTFDKIVTVYEIPKKQFCTKIVNGSVQLYNAPKKLRKVKGTNK